MRHAGAALLVVLAVAGCAPSGPVIVPIPTVASSAPPTNDVISFAVIGDSLTSWDNTTFPYPAPPYSENTWLHWALEQPGLTLAGGWAYPGARTADMAANVIPVDADVVVVQATTNDAGNTPVADAIASLEAAIATVGVTPVIVCAIPPKATAPEHVPEFNGALLAMASAHEWTFVDPWADARTPTGDWIDGTSDDGVHPTDATAIAAASVIVPAIRDASD